MEGFYFNDMWRMDWGLGNPNKTAALIAILMIACWGLAFVKRRGFWLALSLFTGLGVCLVHTFSRGGMVALFAGLLPFTFLLSSGMRNVGKSRWIGLVVSTWILIGVAVGFQAHQRYTQGFIEEDRSISNRLDIWEMAPQMIRDAPGGWGLGNSGDAYEWWYQDLDETEGYRTLVNSHLTWLVEFGWLGRIGYVIGWGVVFGLCLPSRRARWLVVPLGIWLSLAVSAMFSSVAESWLLWIIPGCFLMGVFIWRWRNRIWPDWRLALMPSGLAVIGLAILTLLPAPETDVPVSVSGGVVTIGEGEPEYLIIHREGLFGRQSGRKIRQFLDEQQEFSTVGYVMHPEDVPSVQNQTVVLGGDLSPAQMDLLREKLNGTARIFVINPEFSPRQLLREGVTPLHMDVVFGEFFYEGSKSSWQQMAPNPIQTLPGVGEFVPNWPELIRETGQAL